MREVPATAGHRSPPALGASASPLGDPEARCPRPRARGAASRRQSRGRVAVTGQGSMGAGPAGFGLRDRGPRPRWQSQRIYSPAVTAAQAGRQAFQLFLGSLSEGRVRAGEGGHKTLGSEGPA